MNLTRAPSIVGRASELWNLDGEMACRHIVATIYSCNSLPVNLIRNDIHGLNFEF